MENNPAASSYRSGRNVRLGVRRGVRLGVNNGAGMMEGMPKFGGGGG
ncbi:hypothetical protein [Collimonas sp.]|jgi:hypothetical protein